MTEPVPGLDHTNTAAPQQDSPSANGSSDGQDNSRRRTPPPLLPLTPRLPGINPTAQSGAPASAKPGDATPQSPTTTTPAPNNTPAPGAPPPAPAGLSSPAAATPAAAPAAAAPAPTAPQNGDAATPSADTPQDAQNAASHGGKPTFGPGEALNLATGLATPAIGTALAIPAGLLGAGMGLLAPFSQILNQFGQGTPAMPSSSGLPPSVLDSLDSIDPSSAMSGAPADSYQSSVDDQANQAHAMDNLDKRLRKTLEESASNSTLGRDKIGQIIQQVNANLQALGPIAGTPAGQFGVLQAITAGLQQAGAVLSQALGKDALNAGAIKGMSADYLKDLKGGSAGGAETELAGNFGPTGRLNQNSSPREVFAAVMAEGKRRGYSLERSLACASTMWQESKGRVNAQDPSGQWFGPYQQDKSYAGRRDPNLNISAFFDKLDSMGGRTSRDIWKTIFRLQQAPSFSTDEAAYSAPNSRRAYLTEIQSQLGVVRAMYNEMQTARV